VLVSLVWLVVVAGEVVPSVRLEELAMLATLADEDTVEDTIDDVQDTELGRLVTPAVLQIVKAYCTAAFWSAASQALARQHAIPLKNPLFVQMQAISRLVQPPIWEPEVYSDTQPLAQSGRPLSPCPAVKPARTATRAK
jgi:hypothetical protein